MIANTEKAAKPTNNKRLIGMLCIASVLAAWVLLKDESADADAIELVNSTKLNQAAPVIRRAAPKNVASSAVNVTQQEPIPWQKLQREPLQNKVNNVFKVHSWLVIPKPIKSKPMPPPPPVAPPAPFTYMGKLENSPKGTQVFLMRNGKLYTAIKGQKIDEEWRLESEDVNSIRLTYLPFNLPQMLSKSAKSFETDRPLDSTNIDPNVDPNLNLGTAAEMNL